MSVIKAKKRNKKDLLVLQIGYFPTVQQLYLL